MAKLQCRIFPTYSKYIKYTNMYRWFVVILTPFVVRNKQPSSAIKSYLSWYKINKRHGQEIIFNSLFSFQ